MCVCVFAHSCHTAFTVAIFCSRLMPSSLINPARMLKRMRAKGPDPRPAQAPLEAEPAHDAASEDLKAKRQVFFVTFPHPNAEFSQCGVTLVAPDRVSRADLLEKMQHACAAPAYTDPHSVQNGFSVKLSQAAIFREFHKKNTAGRVHTHYHVAFKAETSFRFAPVKKAMLQRFGLASHWSCTHAGYWSAVRYCFVPSPTKPQASLDADPLLWALVGDHPALHLCCHEPATAAAMQSKRQRREARAAEKGNTDPRVTEYDLWPIVVESRIRNLPGDRKANLRLVQHVKANCSNAVCAYVFKNRARLPQIIDDIWAWEEVDEAVVVAARSRVDALRAAEVKPCVCGGAWMGFALYSLTVNGINVPDLCKNIYKAFSVGRGPNTPVITFAGVAGGEGKSFVLQGLTAVFGVENVFFSPQHPAFPLLDLVSATVALLDDFRFFQTPVPVATQCLWFDGSPVPIARPQNVAGQTGQHLYQADAPVFITTQKADVDLLASSGDGDASMLLRRLKVYNFTVRVPGPPTVIPVCAHCFAKLVCSHSV